MAARNRVIEQGLFSLKSTHLPKGRWLVLAPHSGDETFWMGGSILQANSTGGFVSVVILTDEDESVEDDAAASDQQVEALRAGELLGSIKPMFWPRSNYGQAADEDLIKQFAQLISEGDFAAVFFPMPGGASRSNSNYQLASELAWEALRRTGFSALPIGYEVGIQGMVNRLVDITEVVDKKAQIMAVYASRQNDHISTNRVLALNCARATFLPRSVSHAEGFYIWPQEDRPLLDMWVSGLLPRLDPPALGVNNPLVSIVIRTCNRPETLQVAIRSVAAQTWPNIEVVVVNDGGIDVRTLVEQSCVGSIRHWQYITFDVNRGRSTAANEGLETASGDFIGLLDDDDWFLPGHVSGMLAVLQQNPQAVAAYCKVSALRRESESWVEVRQFDSQFDPIRLAYENTLPIHSVLFRRRVLEAGCRFVDSLDAFEDWAFWLSVAKLGPLVRADQMTACYRIYHGGGFGVTGDEAQVRLSLLPFLRWAKTHWSDMQLVTLISRAFALGEAQRQAADVPVLQGQITSLKRELSDREQELTEQAKNFNERYDHGTKQLNEKEAELDRLRRILEEVYGSRSWRVTTPLRLVGRQVRQARVVLGILRRYTNQYGWNSALRRSAKMLRDEGLAGVKMRLQASHASAVVDTSSPSGISVVWDPTANSYRLADHPEGYTYVPPRRPEDITQRIESLGRRPRFSLVMPVFNTPPSLLHEAVDSVLAQWYSDWELILVDDASSSEETQRALTSFVDERIRCERLAENAGISAASNAAIAQASGDYVVFLDHDDTLTEDCLYELACCIDRDNPDFIYSDEDKISPEGRFVEPHFKPDWSPDTMMSTMYTCHVACMRTNLLRELGGLKSKYDGCQDWDLVLRLTERTNRISHIAKVLYHWRIIPTSVASDMSAKPYVLEASQRTRQDALTRRGQSGRMEPVEQIPGYFRVRYDLVGTPLISIVIPSRDNHEVLRHCLDSILAKSSYKNYEIVVIDNGSVELETVSYLCQVSQTHPQVKVFRHDAPFNFSQLNNIGVGYSKGELLLFLNDDTEVCSSDWLERMGGYAQLSHVGAVGAKLLYPGGKEIQHAGILNLESGPNHAFLHLPKGNPGYFMRNLLEYNWLAVTGACLMIQRDKFLAVGGFDESFPVAYNDVELCIRLYESGYYNVVVPVVQLIHFESASRGLDHDDPQKHTRLMQDKQRLYKLHSRYFQYDPFHNPNLHPNGINFELAVG
ncbi:glycosyltransferase [Nitrosomonas sp. ANs5]|uniref:glycosyltransferase n=1 Tax=Nitrosomonas sp. ANs5 TaxID=3423941 RepID=UPI003D34FADC